MFEGEEDGLDEAVRAGRRLQQLAGQEDTVLNGAIGLLVAAQREAGAVGAERAEVQHGDGHH